MACPIDWTESQIAWMEQVRAQLLPRLLSDPRCPDGDRMAARFEHCVKTCSQNDAIRSVSEAVNELAATAAILEMLPSQHMLRYEFPISGTKKTLDFLIIQPDGQRIWIDVKTVAPRWVDDEAGWKRFLAFASDFPENARFGVQKEWGGAGIFGQAVKARWSFSTRTVEVESKVALIPEAERGPVFLLFCAQDNSWHIDDLEDFADFYRRGKFREDDWCRNALSRYFEEEGLTFTGCISGFHYLARHFDEALAHKFRLNVRGPSFGS
jgi:hypothetical protein